MNAYQQSELSEIEQNQGFQVTDVSSANWCLRKLQALQAQKNEIETLASAELDRIEKWRDKELESVNKSASFFESLLIAWHQEQHASDPKKFKSIKLPYGTLKSTTRKPAPKKLDDDALLQHLKANNDVQFIKVKESPDWAEYKKTLQILHLNNELVVFDENGERVPGVDVDLGGTKFTVEVDA